MNIDELVESEAIRNDAGVEELLVFIADQIKDPYSSSTNYFKKLSKKIDAYSKGKQDEIFLAILNDILDKYKLTIDASAMDDITDAPEDAAKCFYKFFVQKNDALIYIFLREFLYNNKNRKGLVAGYEVKGAFNKEQYGKRDNFVLINKLKDIIKDIRDLDNSLETFISYISKTEDTGYISYIQRMVSDGKLKDDEVVKRMIKMMLKSDDASSIINKMTIDMHETVVLPMLKSMGAVPEVVFIKPSVDTTEEDEDSYSDDN